jgi:ATP-binding cassette subfamily B protein
MQHIDGVVSFRGVSASYGDGTKALDGIDLEIAAGERVALVGHSGSGKSTLASLLLRLQDPVAGSVLIDGRDLRAYTLASLRENVAIVLQESVLFTGTIRDNIRMARPDATDADVDEAARAANVAEFAETMPEGLDTPVGERGEMLSGGQRQRIAIARGMLRDARIVILDEAMAGLDGASAERVSVALERLCAGRTTIVITHTLEEAQSCDRVITLRRGRIVDEKDATHA